MVYGKRFVKRWLFWFHLSYKLCSLFDVRPLKLAIVCGFDWIALFYVYYIHRCLSVGIDFVISVIVLCNLLSSSINMWAWQNQQCIHIYCLDEKEGTFFFDFKFLMRKINTCSFFTSINCKNVARIFISTIDILNENQKLCDQKTNCTECKCARVCRDIRWHSNSIKPKLTYAHII